MNDERINLGYVQETLLLPLWGRAVETMKDHPLLVDHIAAKIVKEIGYDFSTIEKNINPFVRAGWIARSLYFDKGIRKYLEKYPNGTVVNIGCGLDTTFERIDNGEVVWFDLDFPDVIEIRRKYIQETERRKFISESVFGNDWYSKIADKRNVALLMGGVIYYFKEEEIKWLFSELMRHFEAVELFFDYGSKKGIEISNRRVIEQGGMNKRAKIVWGTDNIYEMQHWDQRIKVLNNIPMYKEHKKNYPLGKRIGMTISDMLRLMSLCQVRITGGNVP